MEYLYLELELPVTTEHETEPEVMFCVEVVDYLADQKDVIDVYI